MELHFDDLVLVSPCEETARYGYTEPVVGRFKCLTLTGKASVALGKKNEWVTVHTSLIIEAGDSLKRYLCDGECVFRGFSWCEGSAFSDAKHRPHLHGRHASNAEGK